MFLDVLSLLLSLFADLIRDAVYELHQVAVVEVDVFVHFTQNLPGLLHDVLHRLVWAVQQRHDLLDLFLVLLYVHKKPLAPCVVVVVVHLTRFNAQYHAQLSPHFYPGAVCVQPLEDKLIS